MPVNLHLKQFTLLNFTIVKTIKFPFVLFLLITFLSSTAGVSVYKHYCGDFLEGISLFVQSDPCSDEGGEDACNILNENDCCEDETNFYQLDVDFITNGISNLKIKNAEIIPLVEFSEPRITTDNLIVSTSITSPPEINKIPIYKKIHKIILYA